MPAFGQGPITADAVFGVVRIEPRTSTAYGFQVAHENTESIFALEYLNSADGEFSNLRGAKKLGRFGLELRRQASELPLFLDPVSGDPVSTVTDLALYASAPAFEDFAAAIGIHHIWLGGGSPQYGASVAHSVSGGRLRLSAEYGFYGTNAKRELDAESRPDSVLPTNFGSVRYVLGAEAEYLLWRRNDTSAALSARTDYLLAHPTISETSPSRHDSRVLFLINRGNGRSPSRLADPLGRSIADSSGARLPAIEERSYLIGGIRLAENKLWLRRDVKGSLVSSAPIAGYLSIGPERSIRLEAGATLPTTVRDSTILDEGSYPYFSGEAHLGRGGRSRLSLEAEYIGSGIDHISTADALGGEHRSYLAAWWGPISGDIMLRPNTRMQIGCVALPSGAVAARVGTDIPLLRHRMSAGLSGEVTFDSAHHLASASSRFSIQGVAARIGAAQIYLKYQHNSTLQPGPVQSDEIISVYLLKPVSY